MDKEEFLVEAMKLLQQYISEDEGVASDMLKVQGVDEDEIPSVLHTIENMSKGYV